MASPVERRDFEVINQNIKDLSVESQLPIGTPSRRSDRELSDLLKQARDKQKILVDKLRLQYPEIIPSSLNVSEILTIVPDNTALVAPLMTQHGMAIFIIPSGISSVSDKHILWLDDFTAYDIKYILRDWRKAYQVEPTGESVFWKDFIERITGELWESLLGPICRELKNQQINSIIFIPQGGLQFLPLHAAWSTINDQKHFFVDDFSVSYVPSVYSFKISHNRSLKQSQRDAVVAGVTNYKSLKPLTYSKQETETVARILKTEPLLDEYVTKKMIKNAVVGKTHLHFSCHGEFAWQRDAMESALYLHHDERLTLAEIIGKFNLKSARLATISACESGIIDASIPDEAIGLPAGFLQAGVAGVLSTLWPVDEKSTALFMEIFYGQIINHNQTPHQALQKAQILLRNITAQKLKDYDSVTAMKIYIALRIFNPKPDSKPFEHPYYWAAFTLTGA